MDSTAVTGIFIIKGESFRRCYSACGGFAVAVGGGVFCTSWWFNHCCCSDVVVALP